MGPISGTETEGSDWSISCQRKRGSGSKHGAKPRSGGSHEQTERLPASHSRADVTLQIYGIFNTSRYVSYKRSTRMFMAEWVWPPVFPAHSTVTHQNTVSLRCSLLISNANINTWKTRPSPSLTGSLKHNEFKHLQDADATSQGQNKARRAKQWNQNSVFPRSLGRFSIKPYSGTQSQELSWTLPTPCFSGRIRTSDFISTHCKSERAQLISQTNQPVFLFLQLYYLKYIYKPKPKHDSLLYENIKM